MINKIVINYNKKENSLFPNQTIIRFKMMLKIDVGDVIHGCL
jgi:hypothetical protein